MLFKISAETSERIVLKCQMVCVFGVFVLLYAELWIYIGKCVSCPDVLKKSRMNWQEASFLLFSRLSMLRSYGVLLP